MRSPASASRNRCRGMSEGVEKLTRALQLAGRAALPEQVGNAFDLLAIAFVHTRSYASASEYLDAGIRYCSEHGLELYRLYLLAYRARSELDRGQWADAAATAAAVVRVPRASTMPRTIAQVVLGLVRARRGDPGQSAPLDEAWALSESTGESLRFGPAAAARAEAAWLEGRHEAVAGVYPGGARARHAREAPVGDRRARLLALARRHRGGGPGPRCGALRGPDRGRLVPRGRALDRPGLPLRGGARACRRGRGGTAASCVGRVAASWARVRLPRSSRAGSARAARPDSRAGLAPRPR